MKKKIKNIAIYLDGPSELEIKKFNSKNIKGYTYNPSLMAKLKVKNYLNACRKFSKKVSPKQISFEVFADDEKSMINQALVLSKLNKNIYVKIPITYTNGKYTSKVIKVLNSKKIKLNITAIFSLKQIKVILPIINSSNCILSVFAGRIHDMGECASTEIKKISRYLKTKKSNCKILWASTRQIYDIVMAKDSGCNIITMSPSIYSKIKNFKKNWKFFSLETVKTFHSDAVKSKFKI